MTTSGKTIFEEIGGTVEEIISQVKKLIREGSIRRVIIKNREGKILFQSQLLIGVAGTAFFVVVAPILTAITTFVLIASDVKVLVEKDVDDDTSNDEYEVEAEVIEIEEEEKGEEEEEDNDDEGENGKKGEK